MDVSFEQQGTHLTSLQSLEAPCSAAIPALGWKTHAFLTMILNFSRYLTQQGKEIKVKKNSIFLLLLFFGQLAYRHQFSVPQFLTVTGTKVMYDQPQKYSETYYLYPYKHLKPLKLAKNYLAQIFCVLAALSVLVPSFLWDFHAATKMALAMRS